MRIFNLRFALLIPFIFSLLASCTDYGLDIEKIDDNFYVILGEGGNSGVLISDTVVLVIDTKMKQGAERLRQWVEDHAEGKKIYLVNTHLHNDHCSGNHLYKDPEVIAGDYGEQFWNAVASREDMPDRWLQDKIEMSVGDEQVIIANIGQAHTFADVIVFLKNRKALFTGDVVLNGYHPYLDEHVGSNVDNYLHAMDDMLFSYDAQVVVPGHGETGDMQTVRDFRQYLMDMKEAAENPDKEMEMREKYFNYGNIPLNKAGFDQTLKYIRESETLRE